MEQGRALATILVKMISDVVDRNEDLRIGSGRPLARSQRHNLYMVLIGDPPNDMRGAFVIDRLSTFPHEDWKDEFDRLTDIKDRIEGIEDGRGNGENSGSKYATRIEEMLHDYTLVADDPSSSAVQRRLPVP